MLLMNCYNYVEGGIILLMLFLMLIVWVVGKGISNKDYIACSGLISLLLFHYPPILFKFFHF